MYSNTIENPEILPLPDFSAEETEILKKYFEMNKQYYWKINEELTTALTHHPVFGPVLKMMTPEQVHAQNERSFEMQRAAIFEGKWEDYAKDLLIQGRMYARMNIAYTDWYEVISMYKVYVIRHIRKDFTNNTNDAITFLDGLGKLLDYAMYAIAEAYFQEKNALIREREERFRIIFENSVDYIYMIDKDRNLKMSNRTVPGREGEGLVGKNMYSVSEQTPATVFKNGIESVFENKIHSRFETQVHHDGTTLYLSSTASPVFDENGEVSAVVVIAHDVSEKKKSEMEIRELNASLEMKVQKRTEELKNINKELESFSYSVSHDLRGPLRAISGFTQILGEEVGTNLTPEAKDAMEEITSNATKMGALIDDLLEFSRLGKKQIAKADIAMSELTRGVVDEFKKTNTKVDFRIGDLGHVSGDYGMIRQVLINLLSNAVKYSSKKTAPQIEIGAFKNNGDHGIYIKDNGAGFDMAYYDKLFGVFQRLHRADEFEGTGVGLAIVQRIISKHSGKVWAEAKVNEGATFYFSLPQN
jgi:PAS domain S-box-containing protein